MDPLYIYIFLRQKVLYLTYTPTKDEICKLQESDSENKIIKLKAL